MRDYQKQKVYDWEDKYIQKYDKSQVPFKDIKNIVDYVWQSEGLEYPPRVEAFSAKVKRRLGDATRNCVRFHEDRTTTTMVILHELAHSMTSDFEGRTAKHGELFVGMYMKLLAKYLDIPWTVLYYTAGRAGIDYDTSVKPVFLD